MALEHKKPSVIRIVVADDNKRACTRLTRLIESLSSKNITYSVVSQFTDADEVLDYVQNNSLKFDAIFLDINFEAEHDGFAVARALPSQKPVVLATGNPQFAADAFGMEMTDFIVKPFTVEQVARALERIVKRIGTMQAGPIGACIRAAWSEGDHVLRVLTSAGEHGTSHRTLEAILAEAPHLVRCEKGTLVAPAFFTEEPSADGVKIRLADGGARLFKVSRSRLPELQEIWAEQQGRALYHG